MTGRDHLETYLEGWRLGDGELSLSVTIPDFHYDDPNTGRILRSEFLTFVDDFKSGVADLNNGRIGTPFLTYTQVLISDDQGQGQKPGLAWCWWQATETDLQGAAQIHFNDQGVVSERIAYFTRLPE